LVNGDPKDLEDGDADRRVEEDQQDFHFFTLGARLYDGQSKETLCAFLGE
jgi:hypothetical protein